MTPGQQLALDQVNRVAVISDAVQIIEVVGPSAECAYLRIELSVFCGDLGRTPTGLPIRDRERILIWVGARFPYEPPLVSVEHHRFAGYPHVIWACVLCLYLAPNTEWLPKDGMFGLLSRLEVWLRLAAIDQLDEVGGPIHPPATDSARGPMVIPRCNTPVREGEIWSGVAELDRISECRVDITGWKKRADAQTSKLVGAAVLLDRDMPLEYPSRLGDLLNCLEKRGVALTAVLDTIHEAIRQNGSSQDIYFILGTPMRGIRGGKRQQHLKCWVADACIEEVAKFRERSIKNEVEALRSGDEILAKEVSADRREVIDLFREVAANTKLIWCQVREDRPEVTQRRDTGRPASAFSGLSVELWGCGALGGYIAEWVVRAGAKRIVLRDNGYVSPGILVRQPFFDGEIGFPKSRVLAERLKMISPKCEIIARVGDIVGGSNGEGEIGKSADIVIDATASNMVLTYSEELWRSRPDKRRLFASVVIDRSAQRLLAFMVHPRHSGGPLDVVRKMKLAACRDERLKPYLDAFFPESPHAPFQPEPGCSDATFIGSAADVAQLSAAAVNFLGDALIRKSKESAVGCFKTCATGPSDVSELGQVVVIESDVVISDPDSGFETRIEPSAWRAMQSWKGESQRMRGYSVETGGLLFGDMDEHLRIVWVSEVSGPPPDSEHSSNLFVCGINGTVELNEVVCRRTRKLVQYIGTWHTHPVSDAIPSGRDFSAVDKLLLGGPVPAERLLLVILGMGKDGAEVTASVFQREEFEKLRKERVLVREINQQPVDLEPSVHPRRIGLALSGGGSRAIAFHLGCLRALHDRGLLEQLSIISTVSGGSVIGALFAYRDGSYEDFEEKVQSLLRQGLVHGALRRTVLSSRLLKILATQAIAGVAANAALLLRILSGQVEGLFSRESKAAGLNARRIQPPFRRWVSRTDAFEQTLRDRLYGKAKMSAPRWNDIEIVINSCELRTGTAFRFGSKETGSWRYGTLAENCIDVATAVAASAAFPVLLPAIDRWFDFVTRDGIAQRKRVILTDGGVYENLGITCMAPGRDPKYATNVFSPDYIICCDAGHGQFDDGVIPYGWMTRMARSFEATHQQVQHGLQGQLHMWRQSGLLSGFIYSYLGQIDDRMPRRPSDLVRREEVIHYPTDFSPMSDADMRLLSRRGEQLTRLLVEHYCPEL